MMMEKGGNKDIMDAQFIKRIKQNPENNLHFLKQKLTQSQII